MENCATETEATAEVETGFQAPVAAATAEWYAEVDTWEQEGGGATTTTENQWGGSSQW